MNRPGEQFEAEDLSSRSVRRVETAQSHTQSYRPVDNYRNDSALYVTRFDAERMLNSGDSFFDQNLSEITSSIAEKDMRKKAEHAMRDNQAMVGSKWENKASSQVKREHKRVLNRWSNFDAVNGGFTRVANERESAGRFGLPDPTAAMQRDMLRQEEVEERMRRKASIKAIGHDTPSRHSWEDSALMAPTMSQEHSMSWISDFFKGK
jgi:hypothetical protein